MAISLDKLQSQSPGLVNLRKSVDTALSQHVELKNHTAKIALALDYSGSMSSLYNNGTVQTLAERVLALGTAFDDDGDIDIFIFESSAHYVGTLSINNYQGGIGRLLSKYSMGSTNYADAMHLIRQHYQSSSSSTGFLGSLFGKKSPKPAHPAYVMFITDGEPDSRPAAEEQIRQASREPIFWQFMGVGSTRFDFLSKLDTMDGREIDNAGFFAVANPKNMSDDELYQKMLAEYPTWLIEARQKGVVV